MVDQLSPYCVFKCFVYHIHDVTQSLGTELLPCGVQVSSILQEKNEFLQVIRGQTFELDVFYPVALYMPYVSEIVRLGTVTNSNRAILFIPLLYILAKSLVGTQDGFPCLNLCFHFGEPFISLTPSLTLMIYPFFSSVG